jgi:ubiquinone/menaquinone biosynthesis C-methylase UbiE
MVVRRLNVTLEDVQAVYAGPGGELWELLMGEQIHVGGEADTAILAQGAEIGPDSQVLDVCSAVGGPARSLARQIGCRVTGLDATPRMVDEAARRTVAAGLDDLVDFRLGDALSMPFPAGSFDVVVGQDAWCYVTDKARLIAECARVVKPGGVVAFTDWLETGPMTWEHWEAVHRFMVFPYMETLEGYTALIADARLTLVEAEDLSADFAAHLGFYLQEVNERYRPALLTGYGPEVFADVVAGITLWRDAAAAGKVGRGRLIARK